MNLAYLNVLFFFFSFSVRWGCGETFGRWQINRNLWDAEKPVCIYRGLSARL